MRRKHLFEFEDKPWFSRFLREGIQDFLNIAHQNLRFYAVWAPKLADVLRKTGHNKIIDLCSGGAGPVPDLVRNLKDEHGLDVKVIMSDLYPNKNVSERIRAYGCEGLTYLDVPVNATSVPTELDGVRTLFTSFHHFRPEMARQILGDAYAKKESICVFENTENSFWGIFLSLLTPLAVWYVVPQISPWDWRRFFFTYIIPVLPTVILWDALVSNLRTYSLDEMRDLTKDFVDERYQWEFGMLRKKGMVSGLPYLIGLPRTLER